MAANPSSWLTPPRPASFDDWAQGFYPGTNKPYMSCPGQFPAPTPTTYGDPFYSRCLTSRITSMCTTTSTAGLPSTRSE